MIDTHLRQEGLRLVENRLSPAERRRAEAHLADCPACRAEWVELWEIVGALEAMRSALQALPWRARQERSWRSVWGRVQPRPRPAPRRAHPIWQMAFSMSMVTAWFVLLSLWPAASTGGARSTALGVASAPYVAQQTPYAPQPADFSASRPPAATQTRPASTAAPLPVPTPMPASHG